jgi:ATP-dependent Clp protease ATP-binding subunit ClpB
LLPLLSKLLSWASPKGKPLGNFLFLGPTGVGKTHLVEAMAEVTYGDPKAVIKIDCAEFQHSHEIAKLVGSPPGYLGHRETHPLLTQERLNQFHSEKIKLTFLLFDEIEKASDSLWQLLLGVLDKANLTLGDNRVTDFGNCLIVMTSNLGGTEIQNLNPGRGMGFMSAVPKAVSSAKIQDIAMQAARKKFSPEFLNRIDEVVTFGQLTPSDFEKILNIELGLIQERILENSKFGQQFVFRVTSNAREYLLSMLNNQTYGGNQYGARYLKRVLERNIVSPLTNLLATRQVKQGDCVEITYEGNELVFTRKAQELFLSSTGIL